jgi:asparagine synthase (glutamine-hydrolysing)
MVANRLIFDEHAVTRDVIGNHQKTFSACFDDPQFDERDFIQCVLDATGAESYTVFPDVDGLWSDLERLLWHMDEPFQSTSQYSQYCVMRRVASANVKVTLDGQGADEMLAGYPGYHSVWLSTLLSRGQIARAVREARSTLAMGGRGQTARDLALRVGYSVLPFASKLRRFVGVTSDAKLDTVLRPDVERQFAHRRAAMQARQLELLADLPQRLHHDLTAASLPALLRYEDRNSMAFAIEARTPFLDYRLVEHVFAMPMSFKISGAWTKRVMRDAMEGVLPERIRWRKDKKGFVTPEAIWLGASRSRLREQLAGQLACSELLDGPAVRRVLERELDGAEAGAYYTDIFRWVLLELWMRSMF